MALMLEVLDGRTREVRVRVRIGSPPLAVGRGLDNDVVLDDPYVDGHHARIVQDENGLPVLEDLGSRNGLVAAGAPGRPARIALRSGMEVRVGRTTLRFRDSADPVPPAVFDFSTPGAPTTWGTRWVTHRWGQLGLVGTATAVVAAFTWSESYNRQTASDAFGTAVAFLLFAALWAGVWSVAGRIAVHRFRFTEHVTVVSAVVVAMVVLLVMGEWAAFLMPDNPMQEPVEAVIALGLIAAWTAQHLALASAMTPRRCWVVGLVTCGVVLALAGIGALVEHESFSDVPEFSGVLKPVRSAWIPAGSAEQLEDVAADLKAQVDQLVP